MTKAIAYMRCSDRHQIAGDTWDRQTEAITKYAAANDYQVDEFFRDEGISGKTELENRPGLAAALERIENNGVKVLLVESADRLARDSMVAEIIIREFQKAGGIVITASGVNLTEGDDSNPTAALIRGILALIAEFDRRVTVLKLAAARRRVKARTGRCEGRIPFGSTDQERRTLQTIRTLRDVGYTCNAIADSLNASGIPSKFGRRWHPGTVSKILVRLRKASVCAEKQNQELVCPTTTPQNKNDRY